MAIYTDSKTPPGSMYPSNALATTLGRLEPLLTPEQLKSRFLKGIPLILKIKDPETGKPFKITDEELKDYIDIAIDEAEQETGLTFMPTKYSNKLPYSRQDFESFGYMQIPHRPISSIDQFSVRLSDNSDIFIFPPQWIETSNLLWGQINLIPLAFQNVVAGTGLVGVDHNGGSAVFFNSLWSRPWVAALFNVEYTTGFPGGLLPKVVNQLIGCIATMGVLSQLGAAYSGITSVSLGLDGMSQSTGTPGPNRFSVRMGELAEHRKLLTKKLKKLFGTSFVIGTI